MNKYLHITSAILVLLIISGCEKSRFNNTKDIYELSRSEQFGQIVDEYSKIDVCTIESPQELAIYIEAVVEEGNNLPAAFQSTACPQHIKQFALGYYEMLQGKSIDSLHHFEAINRSINNAVWSSIAFLEHSLYSDDYSMYEMSLHDLRTIATHDRYLNERYGLEHRILPYYEGWYLISTGSLFEAREFLNEKGMKIDSYEKSIMEIEINLRLDKFNEAEKMVDYLLTIYPENQELLQLKGVIIRLTQGNKAWVEYLERITMHAPFMWTLKAEHAIGLINLGEEEKGLKILEQTARRRSFDCWLNLLYADYYLLYDNAPEIVKIQEMLKSKDYTNYPYFHVILARAYYLSGKTEEMEAQLDIAKKLNPHADYVLWFEFDVLNESMKYEEAGLVLDKILRQWPNDIDALYEKYVMAIRQNNSEEAQDIKKKLLDSKRYVPDKYINEIENR